MLNRLLINLLLIHSSIMAQETILDRFSATRVNNEVLLNWTIEAGSTCNGIDIQRSDDGIGFEVIGDIEGVCGSPDEAVSYSFTDKMPYYATNYYRLQLGTVETSEIISIEVVNYGSEGFSVQPNPYIYQTKIFFRNDRQELFYLFVYDLNGSKVLEKSSTNDFFEIDRDIRDAGLYVFVIEQEGGGFNKVGKLLRQN